MSVRQILDFSRRIPISLNLLNRYNIFKWKTYSRRKHDAKEIQPDNDSIFGEYTYRRMRVPHSRGHHVIAWMLGTGFWYWIFWHFYYQLDHLIPHYPYPDPSKWTNEELGIPPDTDDIISPPRSFDIALKHRQ